MTILVTGGAGFIGSHFIELLLRQGSRSILCLDNFNDYYDPAQKRANIAGFVGDSRVRLCETDFCDAESLERLFAGHDIQQVVHLGAYAGVRASVEQPVIYQQTNVGGTLTLLEAVRKRPVRRLVVVSSSTVYGRGAEAPFVEDAPLGIPASPYGASKRAAELLALTYYQLFNVPAVIIRPFSVYGPRLRPDLAMSIFTRAIDRDEPFPLYGDGTVRRDFTHVRDFCQGLHAAMTVSGVEGEAINLGHDEPIEMRRLIDLLATLMGRTPRVELQPAREEDLPVTHADLSKARRLLDYQPQVAFEEGLAEFVQWYKGG